MSAKTKKAVARELLFGDLWEFDPAPESAPAEIRDRYELFINGEFVAPKSKKYFDSISPRNEEKISEIALANDCKDTVRAGLLYDQQRLCCSNHRQCLHRQ